MMNRFCYIFPNQQNENNHWSTTLSRWSGHHRDIWVKGHDLAVTWKNGKFSVSVDGKLAATAPKLKPLKLRLNRTASK